MQADPAARGDDRRSGDIDQGGGPIGRVRRDIQHAGRADGQAARVQHAGAFVLEQALVDRDGEHAGGQQPPLKAGAVVDQDGALPGVEVQRPVHGPGQDLDRIGARSQTDVALDGGNEGGA